MKRNCYRLFIILAAITLFAMPASAKRNSEGTMWDIAYHYNINQNLLPRVLLIGDSICNGYQTMVRDELAGTAYVSFYATSKCVTDPSYLKTLTLILEECDFAVVHFNNGLHSLNTDRSEWEQYLAAAFNLIKAKEPNARIIWCTSTPLKDPALTAKAKELNAIAERVNGKEAYRFPVDDLFKLMDPLDRNKYWVDTYHFQAEARKMQAQQVAASIREILGKPKATLEAANAMLKAAESQTGPDGKLTTSRINNPIKNPGFEGAGNWAVYPAIPEKCTFEISGDDKHGGKKSAKIVAKTAGIQFYQTGPALEGGSTYVVSFWAKGDRDSKLNVHVRTLKSPYVFYGKQSVPVSTEWQKYTTEVKLPDGYIANNHVLFFVCESPSVYFIDDIDMAKK